MGREVAILAVGWSPVYSQTSGCGVAAGYESACEVMTSDFSNNRLDVYLVPTGQGYRWSQARSPTRADDPTLSLRDGLLRRSRSSQ